LYADGGLVDNFPIGGLDNKDGDILALAITTMYTKDSDGFIDYAYKVMVLPSEISSNLRIGKTPDNITLIKICLKNISTIDFSVSKEVKASLFKQGEKDAVSIESNKKLKIWDWSFHDHWDDNFVIY
jgi:predicted acylesterase/phospholipase RssA